MIYPISHILFLQIRMRRIHISNSIISHSPMNFERYIEWKKQKRTCISAVYYIQYIFFLLSCLYIKLVLSYSFNDCFVLRQKKNNYFQASTFSFQQWDFSFVLILF